MCDELRWRVWWYGEGKRVSSSSDVMDRTRYDREGGSPPMIPPTSDPPAVPPPRVVLPSLVK
jgi:hypothetical protein